MPVRAAPPETMFMPSSMLVLPEPFGPVSKFNPGTTTPGFNISEVIDLTRLYPISESGSVSPMFNYLR